MDNALEKHLKETCMACGQKLKSVSRDELITILLPAFYDLHSLRNDVSGKPVIDGVERVTKLQNQIGDILRDCGMVVDRIKAI